ncbi:MAG: hypothetical protein VB064_13890 [Oscillospiraceae bacterium]|nr:hypothetical protein [Oscillospiraceae bacterium]
MQVKDKAVSKNNRMTAIVYVVLRVLVIAILIRAIILGRWDQVFYCALALIEFMVPSFVEKRLRIELPSALEIIVLLFIFAGEILGEIGEFFNKIQVWDLILHTTNGFLMAAIGVALIDVFNKSPKINFSMSPFFVAFVAFCFSMTIGVLWEFTEYSCDRYLGFDMQKDTIVSSVNSYELNPGGSSPLKITGITETEIKGKVNGKPADMTINGYLDIGLNDTMEDMFVNLIGAVVFSIIAAFYIKGRGKSRGGVAEALIPRMLTQEEYSEKNAEWLTKKERLKSRFKI